MAADNADGGRNDPSMIEVQENREQSLDEVLDMFCWTCAATGQHYYPPERTNKKCCTDEDIDDEYTEGLHHGMHRQLVSRARNKFITLKNRGYDPKKRAQREARRERGLGSDPPIGDWSWLESDDYWQDDDD